MELFLVKERLLKSAGMALLIAILLAPSVWMLRTVPPLWKDVDAYIQVVQPPGVGTILHYAPGYCFTARIPLYIGYSIDCFRRGNTLPGPGFFYRPTLSDSGVFVLLLSQHLLLVAAAFQLIRLVTGSFPLRVVLAILWAANPLFYTLAHCVGSETLSMILLLFLAARGLRIVRYPRTVPFKEWWLFGILLWFIILTRHVNAVLAALLPLSFLLAGLCHLLAFSTDSFDKKYGDSSFRRPRLRVARKYHPAGSLRRGAHILSFAGRLYVFVAIKVSRHLAHRNAKPISRSSCPPRLFARRAKPYFRTAPKLFSRPQLGCDFFYSSGASFALSAGDGVTRGKARHRVQPHHPRVSLAAR
jgi:hypothetical protein